MKNVAQAIDLGSCLISFVVGLILSPDGPGYLNGYEDGRKDAKIEYLKEKLEKK